MITLYFLRHGESTGVQQRILQGHQDHPLTAFGKAQAASLSNHWLAREISFDQIITSPLLRARQTAEIIASLLDVPLLEDEIWIERHFGNGEGVDLSVIENWYADHPLPLPHEPIYDTGESAADLHLRQQRLSSPCCCRITVACWLSHMEAFSMLYCIPFSVCLQADEPVW